MVRNVPAALAVAVALAVSACSGPGEDADPPRSREYQRAESTLLPSDALPDGWTEVPVQERLGANPGVPHYCGVRAAPADVAEGRITSYDEGRALDRYVVAWSMVSTEQEARAVMESLAAHRDRCVQEDGRVGRPISVEVGDEAIGWAFDEPASSAFQTIVFRRDEVIVVLAAPATTVVPDDEQRAVAAAIDRRLQDG